MPAGDVKLEQKMEREGTKMRFAVHRRAVTLIEAVLFISIALGLIVGGLVFFQQAQLAARTTDTIRLAKALIVEATNLQRTSGHQLLPSDINDTSYNILCRNPPDMCTKSITEILIASGSVPGSVIDNGWIRAPWGGEVRIGTNYNAEYGPNDPTQRFEIFFTNVPIQICARLIVFTEGQGGLGTGPISDYVWHTDIFTVPGLINQPGDQFFASTAWWLQERGAVQDPDRHWITPARAGEVCRLGAAANPNGSDVAMIGVNIGGTIY